MNRFLSICLLFTGLILSGLHCTAAAQSSDWVYSPYAQYLINDTTIPPPVGEPADAALSYFRHDTIYILVMPTGQLYIWLRPDPLLDKYIQSSPYAYCDGNPLRIIDPNGMDWYQSEDGTAVCWKKGDAATINVGNEVYKNIGENYSYDTPNGYSYDYCQNTMTSFGINVMNENEFISQFDPNLERGTTAASAACKIACLQMLSNAGTNTSALSMATMVNNVGNGVAGDAVIDADAKIQLLQDFIFERGLPIIAAVDWKSGYSSGDRIGDHFIVIMGMKYIFNQGKIVNTMYRFFDPGTRFPANGTSKSAWLNTVNQRLQGDAPYKTSSGTVHHYIVTSLRF